MTRASEADERLVPSVHILGGRRLGGASQFFLRLVSALHEAGQPVIAVVRPDSAVRRALEGSPVEQVHLPLGGRWDFRSARRIRRLAAAHAPCIVQTYLGRATRLTRLPLDARSVHVARLGGFYKIDGDYRHAHAWVGNTRSIRDYLVRSGLPSESVFYIGNFVPEPRTYSAEERQARRRDALVPPEAWVLFGLGRLIEKKGFADLLAALGSLPAEIAGRPLIAVIAGDGEERQQLEAQAERLGIAGRVRWLGWQDPPDPWYDLADVVVVPSRHEPLGNVILEAWNYRRPVVSTASDGAVELIRDGESGVLVPCADSAALAEALRRVLSASEPQRAALGEAGHAELQATHGRDVVLRAYVELYDRLVRERCGEG
jgi:glycosyltransferase involved in cell wall biosynthesis